MSLLLLIIVVEKIVWLHKLLYHVLIINVSLIYCNYDQEQPQHFWIQISVAYGCVDLHVFLCKERDGYKKILESYDCDVTREVVSHSTDKATQLQITVNNYIKVNDQLEKDIQSREHENLMLKQTVTQVRFRTIIVA